MTIHYHSFYDISVDEIARILKVDSLYTKNENNTRFKTISMSENKNFIDNYQQCSKIVSDKFSGILASDGDKNIGIVLYENYKFLEPYIDKFTLNGNKKTFTMKGCLGIYVNPEYRNNNIANTLMQKFNTFFLEKHYDEIKNYDYVVVSATSHCYDLAYNNLVGITLSRSFANPAIWKSDCKNFEQSNGDKIALIKDLYEIGQDMHSVVDYLKDNFTKKSLKLNFSKPTL